MMVSLRCGFQFADPCHPARAEGKEPAWQSPVYQEIAGVWGFVPWGLAMTHEKVPSAINEFL